jgi:8-oxo-dGTP pyrophosphatase MutT (NUDIX family)
LHNSNRVVCESILTFIRNVPEQNYLRCMLDLKSLQTNLHINLPGLSQQLLMSPPYREVPSEAWVRAQNPKEAAVLLLLFEKDQKLHLLFTKRVAYPGVHSSQISFPGGKVELGDASKQHTALREAEEEVGVAVHKIEVLGPLTPLYIPPSNFLVDPFVGRLREPVLWQPQETEVAEILEIPLQYLLQDKARTQREITVGAGQRTVPGFEWEAHFIWGATAMILEEFLAVARGAISAP